MRSYKLLIAVAVCLSFSGLFVKADDWPNWRGPAKNGISQEKGWSADWKEKSPAVLWRAEVGTGFSSVTVDGGKVYTMGNTGSKKNKKKANQKDVVFCFDALTGKEIWRHEYQHPLIPKYYEGGTSATPTIHGGKVYTVSKNGVVFCLDAETGKQEWKKDIVKDHEIELPTWGIAGSILVYKDLLILNAGTHGMALKKRDGSMAWLTGKEKCGYSTPVEYECAGKQCVAIFGKETLAGLEAGTGKVLWSMKWKAMHDENIADPVIIKDMMLVSSHLGKRCSYFKIEQDKLIEKWRSRSMRNWMNSSIPHKGYLYGMDAKKGVLRCIEIETGKEVWSKEGFGLGQVMMADGKLIALSDKGRLVIAEAAPEGYAELASAQPINGKCWTVPVLANGCIYLRNAEGSLVCLDVRGE